jgi:hypothetical protein
MAGILISLLASRTKLSAGVTHSALLSFITGLALVGIRYGLNSQDPMKWSTPDNVKITLKLVFVIAILAIAYKYKKKEILPRRIWATIAALTISNIVIAFLF